MLQLQFLHSDKRPVWLVAPSYTIGSSPTDTIKLEDKYHGGSQAQLKIDKDHVVIQRCDTTLVPLLYGNQAITSKASVRAGETFAIGDQQFKIVDSQQLLNASSNASHQVTTQRGFRIKSLSAALQFREIVITQNLLIGRAEECDLALNTSHLSRRHAKLSVHKNQLMIEDLASSNGTFVNGKKIDGKVTLSAGDELRFDTLKFKVLAGADTEQEVRMQASSDDVNKTVMRPVVRPPGSASNQNRNPGTKANDSEPALSQAIVIDDSQASADRMNGRSMQDSSVKSEAGNPRSSKAFLIVAGLLGISAIAALSYFIGLK